VSFVEEIMALSHLPTDRLNPFDPPPELARERAEGPITPLTFPDGHAGWLVTGHAAAREVLASPKFSSRADLARIVVPVAGVDAPAQETPPGMFSRMDPPDHTRIRRLLTGKFTVRRMRELAPRVKRITEEHVDQMRAQGPPLDLVEAYALPIPSLVICELLGVPYAQRKRFQRDTAVLFDLDSSAATANAAWISLGGFLNALVQAKRAQPTDDLLSDLIAADELTDQELVMVAIVLLAGGHETAASMIAHGVFALLEHPEQLARLRDDETLLDGTIEELLRYLSVFHIGPVRCALDDVTVAGQLVKKGDSVAISLPAVNRDPASFANPDEFDITRPAHGHLAFGHGIHQCLGQQLVRVELRAGLAGLLTLPGLRLAVPADEVPMRGNIAVYGVQQLPVTWDQP
jgi:cytochrome P450